ncbi:MAG: tetratricopeptide repeat protein [Dehalococcoidales bacterium]|nr:tetratricopeptide repeat protein [Dehalococcoidales bacterium]
MTILDRVIKYSLYLLTFLTPLFFLPFSFEVFEYNKQALLLLLVSLAFFAWLAKMVIYEKEIRFKRSPLDLFVLAFLGVAILSAIFSVDKTSSLYGFYGRFSNGLMGLLSLGALYFLITNNVSSKSENSNISLDGLLKIFSWSVFVAVLFSYLSVFGIFAKLASLSFLPKIMALRIFNPTAASLEGLSIFLAVAAVFLVGKTLTAAKGTKVSPFIYLQLAAILVLMIVIDFTPAWLIVLITFALFVVLSLWKRVFRDNVNRLLVPIFLIIVAVACIPTQPQVLIFGEGSNIANLMEEQVLDQKTSWQIGLGGATDSIKSSFLGSGVGTFNYDFAKEKPLSINESWLWQVRFDRAGAHFAEILGTMGFLGILSYLALVAIFFMASYFFLQQKSQALLLLMVFSSLIVGQFVYYQNTTLAFLFWLVLGLSVIAWQKPIKEKVISFKNFPELSLVFSTVVILVGVGFLALYFFQVKFYMADMNYARAQEVDLSLERTLLLEKAVRLNPGLPQYRAVLARAYLNDVLDETAKPQEEQDSDKVQLLVATSINQARVATELAPKQVAMWETLGMIYREIRSAASGATEWGIKSFNEAVILEPNNPVLYTELGKLYIASGDMGQARDQFAKAVAVKADYTDALIQQALLFEKEGDAQTSLSEMEKLAVSYPLSSEILFQLGRLYFNNNQVAEAVTQFKRVVILVPDHSNAHYSLGVAYAAQNKTDLAIEEFKKVLELNPGNEDVQTKIDQLR